MVYLWQRTRTCFIDFTLQLLHHSHSVYIYLWFLPVCVAAVGLLCSNKLFSLQRYSTGKYANYKIFWFLFSLGWNGSQNWNSFFFRAKFTKMGIWLKNCNSVISEPDSKFTIAVFNKVKYMLMDGRHSYTFQFYRSSTNCFALTEMFNQKLWFA